MLDYHGMAEMEIGLSRDGREWETTGFLPLKTEKKAVINCFNYLSPLFVQACCREISGRLILEFSISDTEKIIEFPSPYESRIYLSNRRLYGKWVIFYTSHLYPDILRLIPQFNPQLIPLVETF
jgi:hypothetical protein